MVSLASYKHGSVQRGTMLSQDYQRSTALLQEEAGEVAAALCEVAANSGLVAGSLLLRAGPRGSLHG